jgi:hypothetical protein
MAGSLLIVLVVAVILIALLAKATGRGFLKSAIVGAILMGATLAAGTIYLAWEPVLPVIAVATGVALLITLLVVRKTPPYPPATGTTTKVPGGARAGARPVNQQFELDGDSAPADAVRMRIDE